MYRKRLEVILSILSDFTSIVLSIGCLIALPFFLLAVVSVDFLLAAFLIIWKTVLRVSLTTYLKLIGLVCWVVVLAYTLGYVTVMINQLVSCHTSKCTMLPLWLTDKVEHVGVLMQRFLM